MHPAHALPTRRKIPMIGFEKNAFAWPALARSRAWSVVSFCLLALLPVGLVAGTVSGLNVFVSGQAAVAAEVNANFDALTAAVNDNDAQRGDLSNLATTEQSNVVAALNEVHALVSSGGGAEATFRWAKWSTYDQSYGWFGDDNAELFGGVAPSSWGDSGATAGAMSQDLAVLATLFCKKGYAVSNATVWAEDWFSVSSTKSRHAAALFRVENSTAAAIDWDVDYYATGYGSWGEVISVAVDGVDAQIITTGQGAESEHNVSLTIPASTTSTVIFVAGSSDGAQITSGIYRRTCFLAFYNDSLQLPAGLRFVDDLP